MSHLVPRLVLVTAIASVVACGDGEGTAPATSPILPRETGAPGAAPLDAGTRDAAGPETPDAAAGPAAITYGAPGPWTVSTCDVAAASSPCIAASVADASAAGALYVVFYPTSSSAEGVKHPVITWGNGTGAAPDQYSVLLTHLASWGFVVIASTSPSTGTGQEMLAGEDYLVAAGAESDSVFFGAIDVDHVGAVGHSQGADGAAQALLAADAPGSTHRFITTLVPIELPAQEWTCIGSTDASCAAAESFDAKDLVHGSVFFVDGSQDTLIAPPTQAAGASGEQSVEAYYAATPAETPRAKGTLIGADHNDIQDRCTVGIGCAGVGPKGYLGYLTAWLMYQLARRRPGPRGLRGERAGDSMATRPGRMPSRQAFRDPSLKVSSGPRRNGGRYGLGPDGHRAHTARRARDDAGARAPSHRVSGLADGRAGAEVPAGGRAGARRRSDAGAQGVRRRHVSRPLSDGSRARRGLHGRSRVALGNAHHLHDRRLQAERRADLHVSARSPSRRSRPFTSRS